MNEEKTQLDERLNILRAGVLGANDGIVSVAGVVIGVAAANGSKAAIIIAGLAALLAGAFSMAGGEYVSVSTQADTEKATITIQEGLLKDNFDREKKRVKRSYMAQEIPEHLAQELADYMMNKSALKTALRQNYGIIMGEYSNPWHAAVSSFLSFTIGSLLPFLTIIFLPVNIQIFGTVLAVTVALFLTGFISAKLGKAPTFRAVVRNLAVGLLTMLVTYGIGKLMP